MLPVEFDYKMNIGAIWDGLSEQEKTEATKWIEEYEDKLLKHIDVYLETGHDFYSVDVEF